MSSLRRALAASLAASEGHIPAPAPKSAKKRGRSEGHGGRKGAGGRHSDDSDSSGSREGGKGSSSSSSDSEGDREGRQPRPRYDPETAHVAPPSPRTIAASHDPDVDSRVRVRFDHGQWYGGTVKEVDLKRGIINIDFDDGTSEDMRFPDQDIVVEPWRPAPPRKHKHKNKKRRHSDTAGDDKSSKGLSQQRSSSNLLPSKRNSKTSDEGADSDPGGRRDSGYDDMGTPYKRRKGSQSNGLKGDKTPGKVKDKDKSGKLSSSGVKEEKGKSSSGFGSERKAKKGGAERAEKDHGSSGPSGHSGKGKSEKDASGIKRKQPAAAGQASAGTSTSLAVKEKSGDLSAEREGREGLDPKGEKKGSAKDGAGAAAGSGASHVLGQQGTKAHGSGAKEGEGETEGPGAKAAGGDGLLKVTGPGDEREQAGVSGSSPEVAVKGGSDADAKAEASAKGSTPGQAISKKSDAAKPLTEANASSAGNAKDTNDRNAQGAAPVAEAEPAGNAAELSSGPAKDSVEVEDGSAKQSRPGAAAPKDSLVKSSSGGGGDRPEGDDSGGQERRKSETEAKGDEDEGEHHQQKSRAREADAADDDEDEAEARGRMDTAEDPSGRSMGDGGELDLDASGTFKGAFKAYHRSRERKTVERFQPRMESDRQQRATAQTTHQKGVRITTPEVPSKSHSQSKSKPNSPRPVKAKGQKSPRVTKAAAAAAAASPREQRQPSDAPDESGSDKHAKQRAKPSSKSKQSQSQSQSQQSAQQPEGKGDVSEAEAEPEVEQPWVQCDQCDKWRKLPAHVRPDQLPEKWTCLMNTWDADRQSCQVPEEVIPSVPSKGAAMDSASTSPGGSHARKARAKRNKSRVSPGGSDQDDRGDESGADDRSGAAIPHADGSKGRDQRANSGASQHSQSSTTNNSAEAGPQGAAGSGEAQEPVTVSSGKPSRRRTRPVFKDEEEDDDDDEDMLPVSSGRAVVSPTAEDKWVQCEHPSCQKWRKVPPHIDLSNLPEKWFCTMNTWMPERASCSTPEDTDETVVVPTRSRLQMKYSPTSPPYPQNKPSSSSAPSSPESRKGGDRHNSCAKGKGANDAAANATPSQRPRPRRVQAQRNSALLGLGLSPEVDSPRKAEEIQWVQCDRRSCKKWRKVPGSISIDDLPEKWYCEMNTWNAASASCSAPEDVEKEVEKPAQPVQRASYILAGTSTKSNGRLSFRDLIYGNDGRLKAPYNGSSCPASTFFAVPAEPSSDSDDSGQSQHLRMMEAYAGSSLYKAPHIKLPVLSMGHLLSAAAALSEPIKARHVDGTRGDGGYVGTDEREHAERSLVLYFMGQNARSAQDVWKDLQGSHAIKLKLVGGAARCNELRRSMALETVEKHLQCLTADKMVKVMTMKPAVTYTKATGGDSHPVNPPNVAQIPDMLGPSQRKAGSCSNRGGEAVTPVRPLRMTKPWKTRMTASAVQQTSRKSQKPTTHPAATAPTLPQEVAAGDKHKAAAAVAEAKPTQAIPARAVVPAATLKGSAGKDGQPEPSAVPAALAEIPGASSGTSAAAATAAAPGVTHVSAPSTASVTTSQSSAKPGSRTAQTAPPPKAEQPSQPLPAAEAASISAGVVELRPSPGPGPQATATANASTSAGGKETATAAAASVAPVVKEPAVVKATSVTAAAAPAPAPAPAPFKLGSAAGGAVSTGETAMPSQPVAPAPTPAKAAEVDRPSEEHAVPEKAVKEAEDVKLPSSTCVSVSVSAPELKVVGPEAGDAGDAGGAGAAPVLKKGPSVESKPGSAGGASETPVVGAEASGSIRAGEKHVPEEVTSTVQAVVAAVAGAVAGAGAGAGAEQRALAKAVEEVLEGNGKAPEKDTAVGSELHQKGKEAGAEGQDAGEAKASEGVAVAASAEGTVPADCDAATASDGVRDSVSASKSVDVASPSRPNHVQAAEDSKAKAEVVQSKAEVRAEVKEGEVNAMASSPVAAGTSGAAESSAACSTSEPPSMLPQPPLGTASLPVAEAVAPVPAALPKADTQAEAPAHVPEPKAQAEADADADVPMPDVGADPARVRSDEARKDHTGGLPPTPAVPMEEG